VIRKCASVACLVLACIPLFMSANAIQDGRPDGWGHPNIGFIALNHACGKSFRRCSGTPSDPTVVLTAGPCTAEPAARAQFLVPIIGANPAKAPTAALVRCSATIELLSNSAPLVSLDVNQGLR